MNDIVRRYVCVVAFMSGQHIPAQASLEQTVPFPGATLVVRKHLYEQCVYVFVNYFFISVFLFCAQLPLIMTISKRKKVKGVLSSLGSFRNRHRVDVEQGKYKINLFVHSFVGIFMRLLVLSTSRDFTKFHNFRYPFRVGSYFQRVR